MTKSQKFKLKEIKECEVKEANKLLKEGWRMLKPPVKMTVPIDSYMNRETIVYVMGR